MGRLLSPRYHSAGVAVLLFASDPVPDSLPTARETSELRLDLHHAGLVSWWEIASQVDWSWDCLSGYRFAFEATTICRRAGIERTRLLDESACCDAARAQLYVDSAGTDRKNETPIAGETACRALHVP
jgi:hypothetical protein